MSATFLVTGATGHQGGATTRELLKAGAKVHILVRDPSKPVVKELESLGAVVFTGDYDNVAAIAKASAGVKGVFVRSLSRYTSHTDAALRQLNPIPTFTDATSEPAMVQRFIDAAKDADTLVISTAFELDRLPEFLAADPNFPAKAFYESKIAAEAAVRNSSKKYKVYLRPPTLFKNTLGQMADFHHPELRTKGVLVSTARLDVPLAHLDEADIGKFAAAAFLNPEHFNGEVIEPAEGNYTKVDIAREMSTVAGVDIPVESVEPASVIDPSQPRSMVRAMIGTLFNKYGSSLDEAALAKARSYGITLTSPREYFQNHKQEVLETLGKA